MDESALEIHRSHRSEQLVDALFASLRRPLSSPLCKELIVVQGQGMATWLNMQMSRRAGIWANAEYLYPKRFIERLFAAVLGLAEPSDKDADPYSPESLIWTVASLLPAHLGDPAFEALRRYVGTPADDARLFMLAARIAQTYDEYLTYRPELVRLWGKKDSAFAEPQLELFQQSESSDPAIWQRKLWRDMEAVLGPNHTARLERRSLTALQKRLSPKQRAALPERISLFGLSSLPPMYVRLLVALSKHVPVSLYMFSPCQEYFGDITLTDKLNLDTDGNRLLRAFGLQAAEFNQVLTDTCESLKVVEQSVEHYSVAPQQTLLQRVQADILHFRESHATISPTDTSIQFHACHSPTREVEVIHDQILELVHRQGYAPNEILVMLPDVEAYAPLIDAVFRRDDERFLPYRIADRNAEAEAIVIKAFLRMLSLATERVTTAQVIDLLMLPVVHRRFGITADDIQTLSEWIADAHITWGIDQAHRDKEAANANDTTAWRSGLDRLLLGYALDGSADDLAYGIQPGENIEGKDALLLGAFALFTSTLFHHLEVLQNNHTTPEWQAHLTLAFAELTAVEQDQYWQYQEVLVALEALRHHSALAGYTAPLGVRVIKRLLDHRLEQRGAARGFLASGITLCAMVPMRSVPFKVICVMGMNDGAFPRQAFRTDFNLLQQGSESRRFGDPDRRNEDRYLFLEALCSARERFVVTYVGQSIRDNTLCPPSVVVTELVETLSAIQQGLPNTLPKHIVTRHPLQPFSPRYFANNESLLFSYAKEFVPLPPSTESADSAPARAFISATLPPIATPEPVLALSDLLAFYRSPVRFLLERRLGIRSQEYANELPERDITSLSPLQIYKLGAPLMRREMAGISLDQSRALASASGAIPPGTLGLFEHRQLETTATALSRAARQLIGGALPSQQRINERLSETRYGETQLGAMRISGSVADVYLDKRVHVQFARVTGRTLLGLWIEHLALALQTIQFRSTAPSLVAGRAEKGDEPVVWRFKPVSDPQPLLSALVALYTLGQQLPVPLFPDISFEYACNPSKMTPTKLSSGWSTAIERDAALSRVYGADSELLVDRSMLPLQGSLPELLFGQLAIDVFAPMLTHIQQLDWRKVAVA